MKYDTPHRCTICCRPAHVIVSTRWMHLVWSHVFVFCQALSLRSADEIIITSVDFFCILCFFSLKAWLFDLSLITFKHYKAFESFFSPVPLSLPFSKPFSLKPPSLFSCLSLTHQPSSEALFFFLVWFIWFKEITLHFCLCHYCFFYFLHLCILSKHSGE